VDPFSALIFAAIVATIITRAAGQAGAAQARVELDRAREAIRADLAARRSAAAARLRQRLDAGRRTGPRAGWWWAWAALRASSALRRSARQARRPAERGRGRAGRPSTGPLGRILGAAWRGGRYAWTDIKRQYREARRRPDPVDIGVCERCGAAVATTALAEGLTRLGRRARMCAWCRAACERERQADAEAGRQAAEPAPAPDPAGPAGGNGGGSDGGTAAPSSPADDGELRRLQELRDEIRNRAAEVLAGEGWDGHDRRPGGAACVRCGSALAAFSCTNPCCPLSWRSIPPPDPGDSTPVPDHFRLPVRYCPDCDTQLVPATWHAVNATNADVCLFCARSKYPQGATRRREDVELAAMGDPVDAAGDPLPLHSGQHRMFGREAGRIATEAAAPGARCSRCGCPRIDPARCNCCDGHTDPPPDGPAGPQTAPPPAATTEGDNDVSCEMHTQAGWAAAAEFVQQRCTAITDSAENMLRSLSAKNAGRGHIAAAKGWHDQVAAVIGHAAGIIAGVNDHQDPYVYAVQGAGGSAEVADPDFYDEM